MRCASSSLNRLVDQDLDIVPRTFFFAGKPTPAYSGKNDHEFLNNLSGTIDNDPVVGGRMENRLSAPYNVSLAKQLVLTLSDVS